MRPAGLEQARILARGLEKQMVIRQERWRAQVQQQVSHRHMGVG